MIVSVMEEEELGDDAELELELDDVDVEVAPLEVVDESGDVVEPVVEPVVVAGLLVLVLVGLPVAEPPVNVMLALDKSKSEVNPVALAATEVARSEAVPHPNCE